MSSIKNKQKIVVKVGSSTLTYPNGKLNIKRIEKLVRTLSDLKNSGKDIILVSSGAGAVGSCKIGLPEKPHEIGEKQAVSAIGQCELMFLYDKLFSEYSHTTAQVLLTKDVIDDETRRRNVTNTLDNLLKYQAIPIVNENDTVSYEEIEFGDNDTLSAIVASISSSDLLIIFTDIDGLYDRNPRTEKDAQFIPVVYEITDEIKSFAGAAGSKFGTGGMITKVEAAEIAGRHGIDTIVCSGENPEILYDILDGKPCGTLFSAGKEEF